MAEPVWLTIRDDICVRLSTDEGGRYREVLLANTVPHEKAAWVRVPAKSPPVAVFFSNLDLLIKVLQHIKDHESLDGLVEPF